jgi:hypothetical protein
MSPVGPDSLVSAHPHHESNSEKLLGPHGPAGCTQVVCAEGRELLSSMEAHREKPHLDISTRRRHFWKSVSTQATDFCSHYIPSSSFLKSPLERHSSSSTVSYPSLSSYSPFRSCPPHLLLSMRCYYSQGRTIVWVSL